MNNIRKIIIAFGIALLVYGLFSYIYNTYIKEPYLSICILNRDMAKNEVIKEEYIEEIKIVNFLSNNKYISKSEILKEQGNIVSAYGVRKGQIITKDVISKKDEQIVKIDGYEYISLDIKDSSKGVSYQVRKGNMVNIYYTARAKMVEKILVEKEKIYSSESVDSNVTCKLLENVEIVNIYDSKGSIDVVSGGDSSDINIAFNTVVIRVSPKDALLISNLKEQGEFNLTIVS